MPTQNSKPFSYPEALAAIGRRIARDKLAAVCVMEFENGFVITGTALYESGENYHRRIETQILTVDDVLKLIKEQ